MHTSSPPDGRGYRGARAWAGAGSNCTALRPYSPVGVPEGEQRPVPHAPPCAWRMATRLQRKGISPGCSTQHIPAALSHLRYPECSSLPQPVACGCGRSTVVFSSAGHLFSCMDGNRSNCITSGEFAHGLAMAGASVPRPTACSTCGTTFCMLIFAANRVFYVRKPCFFWLFIKIKI